MRIYSLLACALLVGAGVAGQMQSESSPASTNVRGAKSPSVFPDGRASFALKAPEAKKVDLVGGDGLGKGPFPMTRNADGVWSVTIPAAVPGFHYYWFAVDGLSVNDPGSETYFGYGKETSGIEIPESGSDFYDVKNVPHGEVRERWYFSKTTGEWRRCLVYTPPDYDKSVSIRYPVLLLQHGSGEDETGWTRQGRANFILDNLLSEGKLKPMIVVMDRGYATRAGKPAGSFGPGSSAADMNEAFGAFGDVVLGDLLPMIDSAYRTIPDRAHRAMAGLSMGGMQTLFITLHHPEKFAYIGSFSGPIIAGINTGTPGGGRNSPARFDPAAAFDGAFSNARKFNEQNKLLWLGVGTEEAQFRNGIKGAADALQAASVHVVYFESPGTAHEWQTWRRDLRDFAPRLFQ